MGLPTGPSLDPLFMLHLTLHTVFTVVHDIRLHLKIKIKGKKSSKSFSFDVNNSIKYIFYGVQHPPDKRERKNMMN